MVRPPAHDADRPSGTFCAGADLKVPAEIIFSGETQEGAARFAPGRGATGRSRTEDLRGVGKEFVDTSAQPVDSDKVLTPCGGSTCPSDRRGVNARR